MRIELTPDLRAEYPDAIFGSLTAGNVPNTGRNQKLEEAKRRLEETIRESYPAPGEDPKIQGYQSHFKRWNKTYPVEYQIKTIKGGGRFPQVSALVDCMFLAELKNRTLTSGHELDQIRGDLAFDVAHGVESYTRLNGRPQLLAKGDVILRDEEGILASVLYGPARRTSITQDTTNALYLAWYPHETDKADIISHLGDVARNLEIVCKTPRTEIQLHD